MSSTEHVAGFSLNDVVAYLAARGWHESDSVSDFAAIWALERDPEIKISVPRTETARDFPRRLVELINDLADIEATSAESVVKNIRDTWIDVIRIVIQSSLTDLGTLPVATGVSVFDELKNLLSAAGRATLHPRNAYAARPPSEVSAFLRQARFGPTEIGSYIVPIYSPASPTLEDRRQERTPFARQVVTTLSRSLDAVKSAAEQALRSHGEMQSFAEAVPQGVSANLCDAIIALSKASIDSALDVRMTWASKQPQHEPAPGHVLIPRSALPALSAASGYLRELEPEPDFRFLGTVFRIEDSKDDAHHLKATAVGIVEERERSVTFVVPERNRDEGLSALNHQLPIACRGTLDRRTKPYSLTDVRDFSITGTDGTIGYDARNDVQ